MKKLTTPIAAIIFGIGIIASSALRAEPRTWTDITGKHKVEADFISLVGDNLTLKNSAGKTITLSLAKLSEADRAIAKELATAPKNTAEDTNSVAPAALAEVKVTATAKFGLMGSNADGKSQTVTILEIEVTAIGGIAADAYAMGPVSTEPLTVEGKTLVASKSFMNEGFDTIDRKVTGFFAKHPKDGIKAKITYDDVAKSVKSVGPLKGTIQVMAGGTKKTIAMTDLLTRPQGALTDPQLAATGLVAKFVRADKADDVSVGVDLSGKGIQTFAGLELIGGRWQTAQM